MWVNADSFEFGDSVLTLQQEWARMDVLLEKCFHDGFAANGIARSEFVSVFTAAIRPGTGFERGYILELMDIETRYAVGWSRRFAVRRSPKLNSIANTQGKGRDDFNADIFERAGCLIFASYEQRKSLMEK